MLLDFEFSLYRLYKVFPYLEIELSDWFLLVRNASEIFFSRNCSIGKILQRQINTFFSIIIYYDTLVENSYLPVWDSYGKYPNDKVFDMYTWK